MISGQDIRDPLEFSRQRTHRGWRQCKLGGVWEMQAGEEPVGKLPDSFKYLGSVTAQRETPEE